jgi:hypothetical protein
VAFSVHLYIGITMVFEPGRCWTRVGDKVRFSVSDVFLPQPEGVFIAAPDETEVEGTIVDFSDSGSKPRAFAVVDVVRRQTVIIPAEKVKPVNAQSGDDSEKKL